MSTSSCSRQTVCDHEARAGAHRSERRPPGGTAIRPRGRRRSSCWSRSCARRTVARGTVPRARLIDLLESVARGPGRLPVRRPRLGEDDAAGAVGLAVAATVRVGVGRRERQRSDRSADVCRGRARPRLAARPERVRGAGVAGRFGRGERSSRASGRLWRRWTRRSSWSSTTCTCSTAGRAWTPSRRSRGTFRRARSWRSRREAQPALPLGALRARGLALEIGPDELRMDEAEARQLLERSRPGPAGRPRSPSSPSTRRAGPPACTSRRSRSKASGAGPTARPRFRGDDRFVVRLPALGAPRAPAARRASLPDADRCPRADVGPALRRGARVERLGGEAGVAGALQPVRGAAGPQRGVVSLPPSLPGAAAVGAGASRAGSRAASCSRVRPTGARRTGSRRRRSGTRRRPATSTGWRGWSSSAPSPRTRAVVPRPSSAGSAGWRRTGRSSGTRRSPCSAR